MRTVSDVRDGLALRTTLRQRGHLTLSFQYNVFPSFPQLLQPAAASSMYPYDFPIPTPEVEALTHKIPLTLFSPIVRYVF